MKMLDNNTSSSTVIAFSHQLLRVKTLICVAVLALLISCRDEPAATTPLAASSFPSGCTSAPGRLCPVDEAAMDPTFVAFREKLLSVVRQRDEAKLFEMVDPG